LDEGHDVAEYVGPFSHQLRPQRFLPAVRARVAHCCKSAPRRSSRAPFGTAIWAPDPSL
jgi:hypothetical protein